MLDRVRIWTKIAMIAFGAIFLSASSSGIAAKEDTVGTCGPTTKLCIGVRSDARPFSYHAELPQEMSTDQTSGPLRKAGYAGYMIRICDAVLAEMMLPSETLGHLAKDDIGYYDIDRARVEFAKNPNSEPPSRFGDLGKNYDILCDPATITNERRDDFIVSPPLFLTGISYISPKGLEPPREDCAPLKDQWLIGVVGDSTANKEGIWTLMKAGELPRYNRILLAYLRGNLDDKGKVRPPCKGDNLERIKEFATHSEAAQAFCNKQIYYYVGDLEIITENVKLRPGCDYTNGTRTYTNDRYAIFGKPVPESLPGALDRQLAVARFFQIVAQKTVFDPSILDKAYSDTFRNAPPSRKLQVFYWSIRGGELGQR